MRAARRARGSRARVTSAHVARAHRPSPRGQRSDKSHRARAAGLDTGRLFDDLFTGGALSPWTAGGGLLGGRGFGGLAQRPLYTDVVERDKEYEMRVDVPGARRVAHPRARASQRVLSQNLNRR